MNVGRMCRMFQTHLPHECLGFPLDSVHGTLISMKIANKLALEEKEQSKESNIKQSNRISKHNANK